MSYDNITRHFALAAVPTVKEIKPVWSRVRSRLSTALRALAAGMHASKDYRLLNAMSASQLRTLGLTHADIPQEIHRRHFASLTGAVDNPD